MLCKRFTLSYEIWCELPFESLRVVSRVFCARALQMIPRPLEWCELVIWCLFKCAGAKGLEDLRPIMILPSMLKLYMTCLLMIVRPFLLFQCNTVGARKGCQAQDAIHTTRTVGC